MPSPEELAVLAKNLDKMHFGPDDTFRFKCYGCGKCCKNRDDILLNAQDLFRLARHLKLTPKQVVERHGETYIGSQSGIPIVRLKPVGKNQICPLLKDNRCSVHASKPNVCALYPLGRYQKASKTDPGVPAESGYFVWPVTCGGHKLTTVRAHLESFGIPLEDEFHAKWNEILIFLVGFCGEALSKGVSERAMQILWGIILNQIYFDYDVEQDFLPQFVAHTTKLRDALEGIRAKAFPLLNQNG